MSEIVFADRSDAGHRLGAALRERGLAEPGAIVAGIPRGGIVVAAEVARELDLPLGAVVARKLGAPTQPELAIGALGPDGTPLFDESLVQRLRVSEQWLTHVVDQERAELASRIENFPAVLGRDDVTDKTVIVVDDGVATGATAAAVGAWLGHAGAARRVLALPVAPSSTLRRLEQAYDEMVVLAQPAHFIAVGQWYRDFTQTSDDEVIALLAKSN
jgi:putative phosphoribosyl transferase